jgi:hypothetical protein
MPNGRTTSTPEDRFDCGEEEREGLIAEDHLRRLTIQPVSRPALRGTSPLRHVVRAVVDPGEAALAAAHDRVRIVATGTLIPLALMRLLNSSRAPAPGL